MHRTNTWFRATPIIILKWPTTLNHFIASFVAISIHRFECFDCFFLRFFARCCAQTPTRLFSPLFRYYYFYACVFCKTRSKNKHVRFSVLSYEWTHKQNTRKKYHLQLVLYWLQFNLFNKFTRNHLLNSREIDWFVDFVYHIFGYGFAGFCAKVRFRVRIFVTQLSFPDDWRKNFSCKKSANWTELWYDCLVDINQFRNEALRKKRLKQIYQLIWSEAHSRSCWQRARQTS